MHEMSKPIFPRRQFAWNVKVFFFFGDKMHAKAYFPTETICLKCQGLFSVNNKTYVTTI